MQTFCAMLLGQPEEIALCALSTHSWLAATSFHPGTYTLLPSNAYVLTELLLLCIVFSVIHIRHTDAQCSNHTRQYNFQVQVDPAIYHSQRQWDMYICFRQNRLSFTCYSVNHHYHRPCIPTGRGAR